VNNAVAVQVLHAQRYLQQHHPQQRHEGHPDGLLRHHLAQHTAHSTAQQNTIVSKREDSWASEQ
jgi:hypothetical protein